MLGKSAALPPVAGTTNPYGRFLLCAGPEMNAGGAKNASFECCYQVVGVCDIVSSLVVHRGLCGCIDMGDTDLFVMLPAEMWCLIMKELVRGRMGNIEDVLNLAMAGVSASVIINALELFVGWHANDVARGENCCWSQVLSSIEKVLFGNIENGAKSVLSIIGAGYFAERPFMDVILLRFWTSCKSGKLDFLRWSHETFGITAEDVKNDDCDAARDNCGEGQFALCLACEGGHLGVVKWLHATFALVDDCAGEIALRRACEGGHLELVKWLCSMVEFGSTAGSLALCRACRCGHLEVAKYLHVVFKFGADDVRDSCWLRLACEGGHLKVAKWVHTTFGITDGDSKYNFWLHFACEGGNLEVVKWLHETFRFTAASARKYNNSALLYACGGGHLEVAKWLHATFGFTADDARADNNYALWRAWKNGHREVALWLYKTFELTGDDVANASESHG